jgi:16S rRNA G966 N2-methylase RsmD
LVEWFSYPNELVCDPCLGGGTTAIASLSLGRKFVGCEIDKDAYKVAEQRITTFQNELKPRTFKKVKMEDVIITLGDNDDISALPIVQGDVLVPVLNIDGTKADSKEVEQDKEAVGIAS